MIMIPNRVCDILNPQGTANLILVCEHASNHIPAHYHNLGLDAAMLDQHVAWDIGMGALTRRLSDRLSAPAICATFSRLVIDPNRAEDQPGLIPDISDGLVIPGNQNLSVADIQQRKDQYYTPFHAAVAGLIDQKQGRALSQSLGQSLGQSPDQAPLICGLHSFTPQMDGVHRPWQAGVLWDQPSPTAQALKKRLERRGYMVGDNLPYSGKELFFTMNCHGQARGLPHFVLEIRQDMLRTPADIVHWVDILAEDFADL